MGVRGCYRKGCENIMCDTYIPSVGYICLDCQKEFTERMVNMGMYNSSKSVYLSELKLFMESSPSVNDDEVDIDDFFNEYN